MFGFGMQMKQNEAALEVKACSGGTGFLNEIKEFDFLLLMQKKTLELLSNIQFAIQWPNQSIAKKWHTFAKMFLAMHFLSEKKFFHFQGNTNCVKLKQYQIEFGKNSSFF